MRDRETERQETIGLKGYGHLADERRKLGSQIEGAKCCQAFRCFVCGICQWIRLGHALTLCIILESTFPFAGSHIFLCCITWPAGGQSPSELVSRSHINEPPGPKIRIA